MYKELTALSMSPIVLKAAKTKALTIIKNWTVGRVTFLFYLKAKY
jgi:hypothetical protein